MEKKSRGIRNNNPLNIRKNDIHWKGLKENQMDRSFFQFKEMYWGYRATIKILKTYQTKYGLCSLSEMIKRWAPPLENNTENYITVVSQRSGVTRTENIDLSNKDLVVRIVEAMTYVENGKAGDVEAIKKGYDLA